MLKGLMFILGVLLTGGPALASGSSLDLCVNSLQYHYLANYNEALDICRQDSSPNFLQCMEKKARATSLDVTDVAPACSKKVKVKSAFGTCEAQMQIQAEMTYDRSVQICAWDSSPLMQGCIIDLVQKARFHSEHAIQYCGFAGYNYRSSIPYFKKCIIVQSDKGYGVQESVQYCHDRILGVPLPSNRTEGVSRPDKSQEVKPIPSQQPEVVSTPKESPAATEELKAVESPETPKNKTGISKKVPTPVEIKVQESSKPEMEDQPLDSGSTSNAESLPI